MRKIAQLFLILAACLLLAGNGATQAPDDRAELVRQLEASRKLLVDATAGLTPEQWKFKPAADKWSAMDVAEHLALTEQFFYDWADRLMKAPAQSAADVEKTRAADTDLTNRYRDRSKPAKAPEMLVPVGAWATPEDVMKAFLERRERSIKFVKETKGDLRAHFEQTSGGPRDAHQRLLGMSAHVERHVKQIEEIKAAPSFPK